MTSDDSGRGKQNNLFDANFGLYQVINRDGSEWKSFTVPPFVEYNVTRRAANEILSYFG